jgi:hypothetical protein
MGLPITMGVSFPLLLGDSSVELLPPMIPFFHAKSLVYQTLFSANEEGPKILSLLKASGQKNYFFFCLLQIFS